MCIVFTIGVKLKPDNTAACLETLSQIVTKVQLQQQLQTVEINEVAKLIKECSHKIEKNLRQEIVDNNDRINDNIKKVKEEVTELKKIHSHLKLKQDQIVIKQDLLQNTVANVMPSGFASDPIMSPPHSCPSYLSRPISSPASSGRYKPKVASLPPPSVYQPSAINIADTSISASVDKFLDDICSLASSLALEQLNNSEISSNFGLMPNPVEYLGVPEPSGVTLVDNAVDIGSSKLERHSSNKYPQIQQYGHGGGSAVPPTSIVPQAISGEFERLKTVEEVLDENKSLCTQGSICKLAVKLATDAVFGATALGRSSLSGRADGSEPLDENKLEMLQMILHTKLHPDMPISAFRSSIWPSCRQVIGELCKRYRKKNRGKT